MGGGTQCSFILELSVIAVLHSFFLHTLKLFIAVMVVLFLCGKLKFWLTVNVVKFGSIGFCEDKENVIVGRSEL